MKLVFIVFNISIQEDVEQRLKDLGISCYTLWPRLQGKGLSTGPRMDTSIWPGANAAMVVVTTEDKARELLAAVDEMRRTIGKNEGIKAFLLNVEAMTGDI